MNIKELAEQAGLDMTYPHCIEGTIDDLERFAELVAAAERELRTTLAQNQLDIADRAYFAGKQVGIEEVLAQPWDTSDMAYRPNGLSVEQEPVAWQNLHLPDEFYDHKLLDPSWYSHYRPLYTAPPSKPWVSLTDEEFKFIASKYSLPTQTGMEYFKDELETKLKEKNNG